MKIQSVRENSSGSRSYLVFVFQCLEVLVRIFAPYLKNGAELEMNTVRVGLKKILRSELYSIILKLFDEKGNYLLS